MGDYIMTLYNESVCGIPINIEQLFSHRGQPLIPLFGKNPFPQKLPEVWSVYHLMALRNASKLTYNSNSNLHGLITGLRCFVVGNGYEIAVVPKTEKKDKRLVKELKDLLDEFAEENDLDERYQEEFTRTQIEGETFIRYYPQEDGITKIRFIEPDMILPPLSEPNDGIPEQAPWSYGILTNNHDYETPLAYNIRWPDNTDERVKEYFIQHAKINVNRNVKRGLPSTFPCLSELDISKKLRWAAALGEAARQSISYFRVGNKADKSTILNLQAEKQTDTIQRYNSVGEVREVAVEQREPGSVVDINKGQEIASPPTSNSAVFEAVSQQCLQAVAARYQAPIWLVNGSSDNSSYASSIAESDPFYKRIEFEQHRRTQYWKKVLKGVAEIAIQQGKLQPDALDKLNIVVDAPDPLMRNQKDNNDVYKQLYDDGLMSGKTRLMFNGLDLDEELEQIQEEVDLIEPKQTAQDLTPDVETMNGESQKDNK
jgi:hypothetical protein